MKKTTEFCEGNRYIYDNTPVDTVIRNFSAHLNGIHNNEILKNDAYFYQLVSFMMTDSIIM